MQPGGSHPTPVAKNDDAQTFLNVTLPAYNEAEQLADSVDRLTRFLSGTGWAYEIVIAENGSTDRTGAIAAGLADTLPCVRCASLAAAGRGAALREVWMASSAEIVAYMDVDLSTDLRHLPELISAVAAGGADLAVGSRLSEGSRTTRGWRRELLSRSYNRLLRTTLGLRVRDAQCGFKAMRRTVARELLPRIADPGWFFDTELLFHAQEGGFQIAEIPVRWVEDPGTTVKLLPTIWRDLRGIARLRRQRSSRRRAPT